MPLVQITGPEREEKRAMLSTQNVGGSQRGNGAWVGEQNCNES